MKTHAFSTSLHYIATLAFIKDSLIVAEQHELSNSLFLLATNFVAVTSMHSQKE
jgi:hypothetical protein